VNSPASDENASVNKVVATTLAARVAETANLPVAANVANLSVSLAAKSEVASTSGTESVEKQEIVQPNNSRRELISHKVKAGETADTIAQQYGVSKDTIKWANNLTGDTLTVGKELVVPPVDGVVYTVKDNDTVASLAKKYKTSEERIIAFNDLELSGIAKDMKIIIPSGQLPEDERPGYVAPVVRQPVYSGGYGTSYAVSSGSSQTLYVNGRGTSFGNRNAYGNCTWFAWEYRKDIGRPLPNAVLGNANTWHLSLGSMGYLINRTPALGALMQTSAGGGGYGHVSVVVGMNSDGSIRVREMNYAGYNIVSERTVSASEVPRYNFIH
jgi:surface antigen/LysM repeat protein